MFNRTTNILVIIGLGALIAGGCDRQPQSSSQSDDPFVHLDQPAPATKPIVQDGGIELGDPTKPFRQKAEAGDVNAMVTLADMLRVAGTPKAIKESRQWYQKAADAGNTSARDQLALMDHLAAAATRSADNTSAAAPTPPATEPTANSAASNVVITQPTTKPRDLTKVAWDEVTASTDQSKFKTQTAVAPPGQPPAFDALMSADDHSLMIRGAGKTADDLQVIQIVFRVKQPNHMASDRPVIQASNIVDMATRSNVTRSEVIAWIGDYLKTKQRTDPVYRNGWSIRCTGMAAEGKVDPQEYLGTAVQIEMTR